MAGPNLKCKVYISSASAGFGDADLRDILQSSVRNNAAAGLTGLLIFHEGSFLQVLEGPEGSVSACFKRIEGDARHRQIIQMLELDVQERCFGQWRMGFARPDELLGQARADVLSIYDIHKASEAEAAGFAPGDAQKVRRLVNSFLGGFRALSA